MRTPQQAVKDAIESGAVQAWIDGKKIEINDFQQLGNWKAFDFRPVFNEPSVIWRPVPEPKLRPWKREEVPVGSLYKWHDHVATILAANAEGIWFVDDEGNVTSNHYKGQLLNEHSSHSTDGGKTWHPCGVMEGGE